MGIFNIKRDSFLSVELADKTKVILLITRGINLFPLFRQMYKYENAVTKVPSVRIDYTTALFIKSNGEVDKVKNYGFIHVPITSISITCESEITLFYEENVKHITNKMRDCSSIQDKCPYKSIFIFKRKDYQKSENFILNSNKFEFNNWVTPKILSLRYDNIIYFEDEDVEDFCRDEYSDDDYIIRYFYN